MWRGPQQVAGEKGIHAAYTVRDKHLVQILKKEREAQPFVSMIPGVSLLGPVRSRFKVAAVAFFVVLTFLAMTSGSSFRREFPPFAIATISLMNRSSPPSALPPRSAIGPRLQCRAEFALDQIEVNSIWSDIPVFHLG